MHLLLTLISWKGHATLCSLSLRMCARSPAVPRPRHEKATPACWGAAADLHHAWQVFSRLDKNTGCHLQTHV